MWRVVIAAQVMQRDSWGRYGSAPAVGGPWQRRQVVRFLVEVAMVVSLVGGPLG